MTSTPPDSLGAAPRPGRVATVDLGTNTVLLLVAELHAHGGMEILYEEERFVRLGEGVDATGTISTTAIERVMTALREYQATAASHGATITALGATSASRDARNVADLARLVEGELGIEYEILSGEEEAIWSFRGAISAFNDIDRAVVIDVGGGSTEFVSGAATAEDLRRASLDIGAVRLTERCFSSVPPDTREIRAARHLIKVQLARIPFRLEGPLIGAAGTVNAVARVVGSMIGEEAIPIDLIEEWSDALLRMTPEAVRDLAPAVLSGREDIFAAGVLIIAEAMRHLGATGLRPSPRGLLHGLALRAHPEVSISASGRRT